MNNVKYFIFLGLFSIIAFGGYKFWEQQNQIKDLNGKILAIEKRLGGSEKLECNEKDSIERVKKSVVRITGGESEGSGFAIKEDGLILTNYHVIEFEPSPKVVFSDNKFETAQILKANKTADLAILKINRKLPVITWGDPEKLNPAEELLAIGFPLGSDIKGEASVSKGSLSGRRFDKVNDVDYLQTDITFNGGISGGPMIDICGEVQGINTAGLAGLGMAISTNTIIKKWTEMPDGEEALSDIQKINFDPDGGPLDGVSAFYNYLKVRKLENAFRLLSDNYKNGISFQTWKKGYDPLIDTTILLIENDPDIENRVKVKLATKDLLGEDVITKYFEGYWDVKEENAKWVLWNPNIKEIKEPDFKWFYE